MIARDVSVHLTLRAALVAAAVAMLGCAGLCTETAHAGTYTVRTCHGSLNQSVATATATDGWHIGTLGAWGGYGPSPADGCAQGDSGSAANDDGLMATNDQSIARPVNTGIGWVYSAASGTTITGYRLWMLSLARAGSGNPSTDGAVLVETAPGDYDRTLGFDGSGGVSGAAASWNGAPWVEATGKNASTVRAMAICGGNAGATCPAAGGGAFNSALMIYRAEMTTLDNTAPVTSVATGDATTNALWHGPQKIAFNASDSGAGVYRLLVQSGPTVGSLATRNISVLDSNGGRCADENPANGDPYEFTYAQPCSSSVSSDVDVDSSALPDGDQVVRVLVEDASGNRTTVYGPVTKTIDNAPPVINSVVLSGNVAREGETMSCTASINAQSPAVSYQWRRSRADGTGSQDIAGATSASYLLGAGDVDHKVRCVVTATDAGGTSQSASALTDGPFDNGAVVVPYCTNRPTGPRDDCGDLDGDKAINRQDPDIDGDGAANATDPDPWDASVRPAVISTDPGDDGAPGAAGANGVDGTDSATEKANTTIAEAARKDQNVVPVANPTSGSGSNGSPADDAAVVSAYFERGSGRHRVTSGTATAGAGQRLRIRGALKTHDGRPIAGAKVFMAQKTARGHWRVDGGTISRADGSLLMFTRKGGVSRQLRFVYFPHDGRDANRGSGPLSLKIRQGAGLSLSRTRLRNHSKLRFRGSVSGVLSGRGPRVQVQVRLAAGWSTFASTHATRARHGRFALTYKFMRTTRRTTYRFRVRVVPSDSRAYVSGVSRTRSVVVVP